MKNRHPQGEFTLSFAVAVMVVGALVIAIGHSVPVAAGELSEEIKVTYIGPEESRFESWSDLGRQMRRGLSIAMGRGHAETMEVVAASVLVSPDGQVLSSCGSRPFELSAEGDMGFPDVCKDGGFGGLFGGPGMEELGPGQVTLGRRLRIGDVRPRGDTVLDALIDVARRTVAETGHAVVAVAVGPARLRDLDQASVAYEGWPCKWY